MAILNVLPDPDNKSNESGNVDASGVAGPGFASVSLSSKQNIMRDISFKSKFSQVIFIYLEN